MKKDDNYMDENKILIMGYIKAVTRITRMLLSVFERHL